MLTIEDFTIPVELRERGKMRVWYYKGSDLEEYVRFCNFVMYHGERYYDVVNNRPAGAHLQKFDEHIALLVLGFYHQHQDGYNWLTYIEDFPNFGTKYARGVTTNYNYMYQLGVADKRHCDGKVQWQLTDRGIKFAQGLGTAPEKILNSGESLIREIGNIHISDLIPDYSHKPYKWWEHAT